MFSVVLKMVIQIRTLKTFLKIFWNWFISIWFLLKKSLLYGAWIPFKPSTWRVSHTNFQTQVTLWICSPWAPKAPCIKMNSFKKSAVLDLCGIFLNNFGIIIAANAEPPEPGNTPRRQLWRNGRLRVKCANTWKFHNLELNSHLHFYTLLYPSAPGICEI